MSVKPILDKQISSSGSPLVYCIGNRFEGFFIGINIMVISPAFPKDWILTSDKQKTLEKNGCAFRGQEFLDNHEIDFNKPCYCGRPNKAVRP